MVESEGNSKTTQVRLGSLVKDKSLTHLLVKNASPAVEVVKTLFVLKF